MLPFLNISNQILGPDESMMYHNYFSVAVPLTPLYTFTGHWMFGHVLCSLFAASQVCLDMFYAVCLLPVRYVWTCFM